MEAVRILAVIGAAIPSLDFPREDVVASEKWQKKKRQYRKVYLPLCRTKNNFYVFAVQDKPFFIFITSLTIEKQKNK